MVGIIGTRNHITAHQRGCLSAILTALQGNRVPVVVGCCPTGVDQAARAMAAAYRLPLSVIAVAGPRTPAALRARTLALVRKCKTALVAFPASERFMHSGTWLGVFAAASQGIPTFVFLPSAPAGLPTCRGIVAWQRVPIGTVPGCSSATGFMVSQPTVQVIQQTIV
jgi:hypothetical protein